MNDVLQSALQSGNIAGAYLLQASSAQTVRQEIDAFLQRLFCESHSACGTCDGCRKVLGNTHADILTIDPAGKTIRVDDVRVIPMEVAKQSYEGGHKAVCIPEAEKMTPQSQNALLKVLEEPPTGCVFLLGCCNLRNMLPTILSRCILVKIAYDVEQTMEQLREECGLSAVRAAALSQFAQGDFLLAQSMVEQDFFAMREDAFLILNRLWNAKNRATSAVMQMIVKHENALGTLLGVMQAVCADVLTLRYAGQAVFADKMGELRQFGAVSDCVLTNTELLIGDLIAKRQQCAGLNSKLALEKLLFDILEVVLL